MQVSGSIRGLQSTWGLELLDAFLGLSVRGEGVLQLEQNLRCIEKGCCTEAIFAGR